MTVDDVLGSVLGHARLTPDRPAVSDPDRSLTYGALVDEVARLADGLSQRGVGAGSRVCLFLPNSVDFVVGALACLRIGAIFVPLATTDPPARLSSVLDDCSPTLVVSADRAEEDLPIPPELEGWQWAEIGALRSSEPVGSPLPAGRRVAYAIYTSGTTGSPKGVMIGTSAFAAAVEATATALGLGPDTRTLCVSPFHFDGSFGTLFPTLAVGGAVVIRPREALLFPRTFFRAVANESITYTGFSPSYLRLLLTSPLLTGLDGSTLDCIALGGEASSLADVEALRSAAPSVRVFNRYGPTETTIAVTHIELTPAVTADGTVPIGRPHPGVTFHLVDHDGGLIPDAHRVGELYIGGDQLMDGYWGAPALTAQVLRTDVVAGELLYRTGDLVTRNDVGDYLYVDRADRVIKRRGVRISLVELGEAMRTLPGVSAAACVVFDQEGETGIVAFVVADAGADTMTLRSRARSRLPDTMLPDRIEVVGSLPLTESSKLDERRLLAQAGLQGIGATMSSIATHHPG